MRIKFFTIKNDFAGRTDSEIEGEFDLPQIPRVGDSVYFKTTKKQYKVESIVFDVENKVAVLSIKE